MGKTQISIKQKPKITLAVRKTEPVAPVKKRGRPRKNPVMPKPTKKKQETTSTSTSTSTPVTVTKRTYSLLNDQPKPLVPMYQINTIVQLKITRAEIENYEKYGYWEDGQLLNKIKTEVISEPQAYNDLSIGCASFQKPQQIIYTQTHTVVPTTKKTKNPLAAIIKPFNNNKNLESLFVKETKTEIEHRRNLIINSGVTRKLYRLMTSFNDNEWPNDTPYDCWYCTESFNVAPVGIPETLIKSSNPNKPYVFKLYGNFCSYNCAARYLNPQDYDDLALIMTPFDLISGDERSEQNQLLELLCYLETDLDLNCRIKLAPRRLTLKKYGGTKTIDEFRENFSQHNEYHIYKTPLVPIVYRMEDSSGSDVHKKIKQKKPKEIDYDKIEKAYQELNTRRNVLKATSVFNKILKNASKNEITAQT